MNLRRIVDFSVCLTFFLLGWNGNFEAAYMLEQTGNLVILIILAAIRSI